MTVNQLPFLYYIREYIKFFKTGINREIPITVSQCTKIIVHWGSYMNAKALFLRSAQHFLPVNSGKLQRNATENLSRIAKSQMSLRI